jgi:hypothetical protein
MSPKNEKRPLTLSSLGTPEQPSPRTARAQDTVLPGRCKFHLRASAWHKAATLGLSDDGGSKRKRGRRSLVEHFLPELVYCESLPQRRYTSMQVFALWSSNPVLEIQRKLLLFNHIRFVLLWK